MKILLLEPFSGISGDMFISSLISAGLDEKFLLNELKKLKLSDKIDIEIKDVKYNSISAKRFIVKEKKQVNRTIHKIISIINNSNFSNGVKTKSIKMINKLAEAEKKIHKSFPHFHELGELDTIIDIIGAVIGLKKLNIKKIFSKPVNVGNGFVKTVHGIMPVPAPATAEILKGIPVYSAGPEAELVTPTGAVILAELVDDFVIPELKFINIGYGAGKNKFKEFPNLLRSIIAETNTQIKTKILMETNIDNMRTDIFGYVMEKLMKAGALDVFFESIYMKKNRPGIKLSCLCDESLKDKLLEIIFTETTTNGVRIFKSERIELERVYKKINTEYGKIHIKESYYKAKPMSKDIEYEECKKIALKTKTPLKNVIAKIKKKL